jgi:hypothetical protein
MFLSGSGNILVKAVENSVWHTIRFWNNLYLET